MDVNTIDIIGQRKNCGLDLFIVLDSNIEDQPDEQTELLDKIENYISYIKGDAFKSEFPEMLRENISIVLSIKWDPSTAFMDWSEKIATWVQEQGIKYVVKTD